MIAFLLENRGLLQYGAILVLALACWIWGRAPERWCGTILLSMPLAEIGFHLALGPGKTLGHTDLGHLLLDVIAAAAFLAIALYANRSYPLWLVSFQLVACLSHLVRNLVEEAGGTAYVIMTVAPSYALMAVLAVGLIAHRRREKRFGRYRSWRTCSRPSRELMPRDWRGG